MAIEVDETGEIIDGHHGVRAWRGRRNDGVRIAGYPRQAVGPFRSIVAAVTKPGILVLDCCGGQGTSSVAASAGGRFIGVDVDEAALALAKEQLTGLSRTAPA